MTIQIPLDNQSTLRTIGVQFKKGDKVIIADMFQAVEKDSNTYQWTYDLFEFCVPGDIVTVDLRISDRRDGSYYISVEQFVIE